MDIFEQHPQWNDVKKICSKLRENGFTAWLAGGCVRDGLLGILPKDFDIATNARPKKIESLFNKTVDVGKAFGVMKVVEPSGEIEVATFRKDGPYTDGRHPTSVEMSTPQEDAKRRDFTVNAMFYDIFEKKVHDFVEGQADLISKIIRTVGVPIDRFMEDRLRIFRAVRFVSQLDFNLDQTTWDAVCKFSNQVSGLAWERIGDEFAKLFKGKRPDRGMTLLKSSGLLDHLIPDFVADSYFEAFYSNLISVPDEDRVLLGWSYIFKNVPSDKIKVLFRNMKLSGQLASNIEDVLEIALQYKIFDGLSPAEKRKSAAEPLALQALQLRRCLDEHDEEVASYVFKNRVLPEPYVQSGDLVSLGYKPGKQFGEILSKVFDEQLSGNFKDKGDALSWIKKTFKQ